LKINPFISAIVKPNVFVRVSAIGGWGISPPQMIQNHGAKFQTVKDF
jgi:hypothetical protein